MIIAGVVIVTTEQASDTVLDALKAIQNITTYGIHKDNNIIAVFEGETPRDLEFLNNRLLKEIPEILGIYPAYVTYEDELDEQPQTTELFNETQ